MARCSRWDRRSFACLTGRADRSRRCGGPAVLVAIVTLGSGDRPRARRPSSRPRRPRGGRPRASRTVIRAA
jgi:hypothetical protein